MRMSMSLLSNKNESDRNPRYAEAEILIDSIHDFPRYGGLSPISSPPLPSGETSGNFFLWDDPETLNILNIQPVK